MIASSPPDGGSPPPPPEPPPAVSVADTGSDSDLRRLLWGSLGAVLALLVVLGILGYAFQEPVLALSRRFVTAWGAPGVGVGFFLADLTLLPIPHDAFLAFGLLGGLPMAEVAGWAWVGSALGSSLAFALGRVLGATPWFLRLLQRWGGRAQRLHQRYGVKALLISTVTPLRFSLMCWVCGAMGTSWKGYFLALMARGARILLWLLLIDLWAGAF